MTREEAIKYLIQPTATTTEPSAEYQKQREAYQMAIEALKQPERKKGKWLPYLTEGLIVKCSVCGSRYDQPWRYCPNCGSYNGGEQRESN